MQAHTQIQTLPGFKQFSLRRGAIFGLILMSALLAFETFNYSTTDFALTDLLGMNLRFMGLRWATILTIAFCGVDFAGIARLFTPENDREESSGVWYLFTAWLLAASMNAGLTWWGVSVAVHNHQSLGGSLVGNDMLFRVVPVFVAVMVWLIRVLVIGTFSMAGGRIFSLSEGQPAMLKSAFPNTMPVATLQQAHSLQARGNLMPSAPRPKPGYHQPALAAQPRSATAFQQTGSSPRRT